MKVLDLFSGIGGFSVGLEATGMQTVAFCEPDKSCKKVLKKNWPEVPIYDDVRELTAGRLLADGIEVDVITGGFPCQDISIAGSMWLERGGIHAERSGLWFEYARLIRELRPRYAVLENVPNLLAGDGGSWFGTILGNLASLGYDAEWHCIPASALGAQHHRDRVFAISYPSEQGLQGSSQARNNGGQRQEPRHQLITRRHRVSWRDWETEPNVGRVVDGLPFRAHRIRGLGNAIVPQIATMIGNAIWDNSGS
jgi:DNA (cytosine-5)-methyltransferase 1